MVYFIKIPSRSLEPTHLLVSLVQIQLIDAYTCMYTYMHTYVGGWDSHIFGIYLNLTYIMNKNLY
jgi:hypothetical protein